MNNWSRPNIKLLQLIIIYQILQSSYQSQDLLRSNFKFLPSWINYLKITFLTFENINLSIFVKKIKRNPSTISFFLLIFWSNAWIIWNYKKRDDLKIINLWINNLKFTLFLKKIITFTNLWQLIQNWRVCQKN